MIVKEMAVRMQIKEKLENIKDDLIKLNQVDQTITERGDWPKQTNNLNREKRYATYALNEVYRALHHIELLTRD